MRPRKFPAHLSRERRAWQQIIQRCSNPLRKDAKYYLLKGIQVCPQWQSFEQFLQDIGPSPSPAHWLGRRDTKGHYTPENCQWVYREIQMRRRGFCQMVTLQGRTMTSAEAARMPNMPADRYTVVRRWASGFSLQSPPGLARLDKRFIWLTYQGETLPTSEWARRIGLPTDLVLKRAKAGMPVERVLHPERFQSFRPHKQAAAASPETITN
jgi:hypothetical protein